LRLSRFGIRHFPQKRLRLCAQSERVELAVIRTDFRRPNADVYDAQCRDDTDTMSHHRGRPERREREPDTVLPEGVLSQRLYQEPEAARPFLQHARRVSDRIWVSRHVGTLPGRDNRKGRLLADA